MSAGRKQSTGRFESRAELCRWVWWNWLQTKANLTDIARQCHVSPTTVSKIIDRREHHPSLYACATEVACLFRHYDRADWFIDRIGNMEFLDDQLFGDEDALSDTFFNASLQALNRYGCTGYII